MESKKFFSGLKINLLNRNDIINTLIEFAKGGRARTAFYLNAHCVNISFTDSEYKKILQKADLVYADGQSIVWAARFLGVPLPERVNIEDFFDDMIRILKEKEITIYLLGGRLNTVKKTEYMLINKGLKVAGSCHGFFDKNEEVEIIKEINVLHPDILMVGLGVPKQEKWIQEHMHELNTNLCWAVGAAFDWLSGSRKRTPRLIVKCGLQWLCRLCRHPKGLWKRCLIGNPIFVYRIFERKIRNLFFL